MEPQLQVVPASPALAAALRKVGPICQLQGCSPMLRLPCAPSCGSAGPQGQVHPQQLALGKQCWHSSGVAALWEVAGAWVLSVGPSTSQVSCLEAGRMPLVGMATLCGGGGSSKVMCGAKLVPAASSACMSSLR